MRLPPYLTCLGALAACFLLSLFLGPEHVAPSETLRVLLSPIALLGDAASRDPISERIVLGIRLPDAVKFALTGAALAGSGAAYQGLLRNPLADPYLIGVAPGAALGAVIALVAGWPRTALGSAAVPAAAFAGALITVGLVYRLAQVGRSTPVTTLVLAGVAVGAFANSVAYFLLLRNDVELRRIVYFMLGGFQGAGGWTPVVAALPYIAFGLATVVILARPLNVLQFGDEQAAQLGLPVERVKILVVTGASLAAAASVAFLGIVGFVGLVVPHLVRLVWGADYRRLIPLSVIAGAAFLLAADTANRSVDALRKLPLGVITAFIGAPFFVFLLRTVRRSYW